MAAIARHAGVELSLEDWQEVGLNIPLLVNLQPAGQYLGEDYYRAGGTPAVVRQLLDQGLIRENTLTVTGKSLADNCRQAEIEDPDVIRSFAAPLKPVSGFLVLRGNLFSSAIMKLSVISETFRKTYLENPADPNAFEGDVVVFDGPEDYHARIDDPALGVTASTILVMRGAGPVGYPGAAEVVNMRPPAHLLNAGIEALPCLGDGRQSGTSGSPSILNVSPEAAIQGGLAIVRTGDRLRIDLNQRTVTLNVTEAEIDRRLAELAAAGGYAYPESATPWQEIQRALVGQLETGAILEGAEKYQRIAQNRPLPRNSH